MVLREASVSDRIVIAHMHGNTMIGGDRKLKGVITILDSEREMVSNPAADPAEYDG